MSVNPKKLQEEVSAALGYPVTLGIIDGVIAKYVSGGVEITLSEAEQVTVSNVMSTHDPAQLTEAQSNGAFISTETPVSEASALSDLSAFKGKTYAEIKATVQGEVDGWATLADAKVTMRKWLPIIIAAFIWSAFEQLHD